MKSSLCDYIDGYILANGTITIDGAGSDDAAKRADTKNKGVIFKNYAPFTDWISEINKYTNKSWKTYRHCDANVHFKR